MKIPLSSPRLMVEVVIGMLVRSSWTLLGSTAGSNEDSKVDHTNSAMLSLCFLMQCHALDQSRLACLHKSYGRV